MRALPAYLLTAGDVVVLGESLVTLTEVDWPTESDCQMVLLGRRGLDDTHTVRILDMYDWLAVVHEETDPDWDEMEFHELLNQQAEKEKAL